MVSLLFRSALLVTIGACFSTANLDGLANCGEIVEDFPSERQLQFKRPKELREEILFRILRGYKIIQTADEYVEATGFDGSKPIYFDFTDRFVEDGACLIDTNDILKSGQLILVDWTHGVADQENVYIWKVNRANEAAETVARFIKSFKDLDIKLDFDLIHFRAEGIGAHIAAKVISKLGRKVATILAVNPARAVFEDEPLKNRLDKSDARYVSVIHYTDDYDYSMQERIGHSDIYIIGGRSQLGFNQNRQQCVISPSNYTSIAYSCRNQRRFLEGKCLDNPSIRINSVLDDETDNGQGVFYHKLSVIGNNGPFIGDQLEYIKHVEETSRHFRILVTTRSIRNQMRIEASLSDDGQNFYETMFTPILSSNKRTPGSFEQMITRPATKGTQNLRFTLRYRYKLPFFRPYFLERILVTFPEFGSDSIVNKRLCWLRLPVTEDSKSPRGEKISVTVEAFQDGEDCGIKPESFP